MHRSYFSPLLISLAFVSCWNFEALTAKTPDTPDGGGGSRDLAVCIPLGTGGAEGLAPDFVTRIPGTFMDGTSNTFLIVEADEAVPWSKPQDLAFDAKGPVPRFSKRRSSGFLAAMGDGSVKTIPSKTDDNILRAFTTANGGEVLPANAP